ncbi:MAG TPA: hypothetical protein VFG33_35735 [Kribbella sp.]|uniref:hypothetical protein n=1 Tax=Kribbella sp. TaxID=1871183 RepID=UPI002D78618F|nr:hypothetical protein [Kribbella sp.]HET6298776.1 hypothetical protein [Kribbella sp.]
MPRPTRKNTLATLAALPAAGALALAVLTPGVAQAATGYHAGTANITVEGETINACPYFSVSAITDAINDRASTVVVTNTDVTDALGTGDLGAFQRSNCRRSDDDNDNRDRRRGTSGTTVIDCDNDDDQVRVLDTRYRDSRDRYNQFYDDRFRGDNSLLNLSVLRGLYNDYLREERTYRDRANTRRERIVVDCGDKNSSSAAPAPTTVNNYQVVQAPPAGGTASGGVTYRAPRGGAETGQG